jgi:hypothetical protein
MCNSILQEHTTMFEVLLLAAIAVVALSKICHPVELPLRRLT